MYPINSLSQLPTDPSYVDHEKNVRKFYKDNNVPKFVENNQENNEVFAFMDGPPFASGDLHIGHLAVSSIKDLVLRFNTMHGKKCLNMQGVDCHGLPCEQVIMKKLDIKTSEEIEKFGIQQFCTECKNFVKSCSNSWQEKYDAMGRWVNCDNAYKTMDTNYMETVWWTYKEMYKKGLTYKGYKVMPFSTGCETPLSNFEAGLNYKEELTNSVYVCFAITSEQLSGHKLVAWTTTPWTLLSNVALCVGPEIRYVVCETNTGDKYIVAESSILNLKLDTIVSTTFLCLGKELVGLEYQPLFDYLDFHYHKVLADTYVQDSTDNTGTGIVHISPAHGEDDCRVCMQNDVISSKTLAEVLLINSQGKYTEKAGEYSGMYVFDTNKVITKYLKELGKILRVQEIKHQYPYCYRTDTKLLYMAVLCFFAAVSEIKNDLVKTNEKITWTNKDIGEKRFKLWLENAKDWCISRNRYFGTPIPVWESEDGTESLVIGSIDELVTLAGLSVRPTDIHLDVMKDIVIISPTTGNTLKCCDFVFDCWFESGCVPFGQIHYPFENANAFDDKEYLCDFVAEGLDQTRGWFYTLLVISTIITNKPPFKTVICSGIILDEHGQKISKKYGNFVDPNILIDKYGADTLRLMMLKSPLVHGEPLLFKESDAKDVFQRITPYTNVVKFFLEHYINSQKKDNPIEITYLCDADDYLNSDYTLMDLWILEKVYLLRESVEQNMMIYRIDAVTRSIIDFVDDLANWYVKFNRDRLKGLKGEQNYQSSLSVLFTVLFDYCVISAPFTPFLSEHIYQYLSTLIPDFKNCTVHLEAYPDVVRNHNISSAFSQLQKLSKMIRSVRDSSKTHTSIRIPIKNCTIYYENDNIYNNLKLLVPLIEDEVNCQTFEYIKMDNDDMIVYLLKPNFKEIGQTFKGLAKGIVSVLGTLDRQVLKELYEELTNEITINVKGDNIILNKTYFQVVTSIKMTDTTNTNIVNLVRDSMLISVDVTYDENTHNSYQIKNLISFVQNCRKEMKLNPWNKISLKYYITDNVVNIFNKLLLDGADEIKKKLGTKFVQVESNESNEPNELNDNFGLFKFNEFGKKDIFEVAICVTYVECMEAELETTEVNYVTE